MFGAPSYLGRRYGQNALADLNPELVVGLRTLKQGVWFVNSAAASGGNGASWDGAVTTLAAAIALAQVNDVILVAPGHTESITAAAGIAFTRAGVTVLGLGSGSARPTFTFTTAVTADLDVDAANITLVNLLFVSGITALVAPLDINAADFSMVDCETRDGSGLVTLDWIVVATAAAHRGRLVRHVHRGDAGDGADTFLSIREAVDGWVVEDAYVDGNFDEGCIENVTTACTNLSVYGAQRPAFFRNRGAEDLIVALTATTTGNVGPNIFARLADNAANITEAFAGADMQFFQPIAIVNLDGESSMQTNITASTDA